MQKRNVLDSPRLLELKKKRRRVVLIKTSLLLLIVFIVFACFAYVSRIPNLNITDIEVTGNKVIDTETVKMAVRKEITGNYLWFFPKTNIFFYPKNNIQKELDNQFKRIKDIDLSIKEYKTLEVKLTERESVYTWCGNTPEATPSANQKCYFLDGDGYIFDEAPYFSGEVYFKFYGLANFGTYFSKENFKKLVDLKDSLITLGLKPVSLYMLDDGDIKIFLSNFNKTISLPYIILGPNSDSQNIIDNLGAALNTEPLQSNFKNKYSSLLYIDLRYGNKVYYKFK